MVSSFERFKSAVCSEGVGVGVSDVVVVVVVVVGARLGMRYEALRVPSGEQMLISLDEVANGLSMRMFPSLSSEGVLSAMV